MSFACSFVIFVIFSLWGRPLSYSVLSICYFCFSCLLMLFSLDSLFSLFWLYLWGRLPSSVFKNCYFCCCHLFHLLFLLDLLSSSVFKSCLVKFDIIIFFEGSTEVFWHYFGHIDLFTSKRVINLHILTPHNSRLYASRICDWNCAIKQSGKKIENAL